MLHVSWPGVHHLWSWHVGAWISCWTRSELELSQGSSGGVRLPANVGGGTLSVLRGAPRVYPGIARVLGNLWPKLGRHEDVPRVICV